MAWITTGTANGPTTLTASVRDTTNNTGAGSIQVTVQNAGPGPLTAGFSSPASGATVSGTVGVGMAASGGTAPYTYTLTIDGSQVASSGSTTYSWNTAGYSNAAHTLGLTVRDTTGATATASRTVTVQNGGPALSASFTSPADGATVGATVGVGMAASGGTAPYTYTLTIDGSQVASSGSTTYSWNTAGYSNAAHTLGLTVRDTTGATATASRTVTVQNGGPALSASFTSPADGATVGATVTVGMAASGGTAPYTYTLTIDGSQVASSGSTTYSWNTAGYSNAAHTLGLTVRDTTGATATASRTVTVQNGGPALSASFTSPADGATVGATVTVGMAASGGTAPYTYTLTIDGSQVASSGSNTYSWNTAGYGNAAHTLGLTVRDTTGATATASRTVTVQNGGPALSASITSPTEGALVSGTITVSMAASGGTAPYTYTLTIDGSQVASSGSTTYSWNTAGYSNAAHTLGLTVRDTTGATATATRTVTVQNNTGTINVFITQPANGATVTGTVWVVIWIENAAAG